MHTATVLVTIALNTGIGLADLLKARFVLATSAAVDVRRAGFPLSAR
jgi:hypothetical protein